MKTVIETTIFKKQVDKIWSEDERLDFVTYISANSESGDVIPGADGARKIRWATGNSEKRGGARIIYFNIDVYALCLVAIYKKQKKENMRPGEIKEVR